MQRAFRMPLPIRGGLRLFAGGLLMGGLMACGYKGPLYLPPPEAPPATLTEPPAQATPPGTPSN